MADTVKLNRELGEVDIRSYRAGHDQGRNEGSRTALAEMAGKLGVAHERECPGGAPTIGLTLHHPTDCRCDGSGRIPRTLDEVMQEAFTHFARMVRMDAFEGLPPHQMAEAFLARNTKGGA